MPSVDSYAGIVKKYVLDDKEAWRDADDVSTYPTFRQGDEVHYKLVVTNTGQGALTNIEVSDDKQPTLGGFHIDALASGESQSHEYSITLGDSVSGPLVNTACATAEGQPSSALLEIPCDTAGLTVVDEVVPGGPDDPGEVEPGGAGDLDEGDLAKTGNDVWPYLHGVLILTVLGGLLLVANRRRASHS
jgi:hypothetical protein